MENAEKRYLKAMKRVKVLIEKQNKNISIISNLRLFIFTLGTIFTIVLYLKKSYYISITIFIAFLILFIWVASIHNKVINNKKYSSAIYEINHKSLKRLKGEWTSFTDTGEEFIDNNNKYSGDLDIFGKNSLFQWINTAFTYTGRINLKDKLLKPAKDIEEIKLKQEAIAELSKKLSFRQRLIAEGLTLSKMQPLDTLYAWIKIRNRFYEKSLFIIFVTTMPVITIALTILLFINHGIPFYLAYMSYLINMIILFPHSVEKAKVLNEVNIYKNNLKVYYNMLKLIEKNKFHCTYLKSINITSSSKSIDKLTRISGLISMRNSSIYMVINILFLWDYQCLIRLEKWKNQYGDNLKTWIDSIGEIEALSSLSLIHFDHPEWVFPNILDGKSQMSAVELGHPLLSEKRVYNDVTIKDPSNILLITGSNMSGKSTFLRTIGINLILSYTGSPVCAKSFNTSIMEIYTCMRISDNLEESISSFYAELIRIKMIVSASKEGKQIFFLLDEIFKGTNSLDRHTGAKILIKQLQSCGAVGLVSTHDLELGELEKESTQKVKNYHFREYYKNNQIHFDYKLRPGVSTTRNALYLIKLAGLDIKE